MEKHSEEKHKNSLHTKPICGILNLVKSDRTRKRKIT